jgi:hypothetical protein
LNTIAASAAASFWVSVKEKSMSVPVVRGFETGAARLPQPPEG